MAIELIEDRAGVPFLVGTRIAVDDVLGYLLDPELTEEVIGPVLSLTSRQVAAARAYILANPDTTLTRHFELETRPEPVNPPEVIEMARRTQERFQAFREWLADRKAAEAREQADRDDRGVERIPSFREWLAGQATSHVTGP